MRAPIVLAALAFLPGCASPRPAIPRAIEREDEMAGVVTTLVPIGTSLEEARTRMEQARFRCRYVENGTFLTSRDHQEFLARDADEGESPQDGPTGRTGLDHLLCERDEPAGFMVSRRWRIALVVREGRVAEILTDAVYTGP